MVVRTTDIPLCGRGGTTVGIRKYFLMEGVDPCTNGYEIAADPGSGGYDGCFP
ncbi:hypothetical protein [Streptomyces sp. NPDC018711]|uniref:hypothetical protein n=1 Tax=Streptomyces sp. NPDC018711 TaxID=3365052 RepID=UPI00379B36D3